LGQEGWGNNYESDLISGAMQEERPFGLKFNLQKLKDHIAEMPKKEDRLKFLTQKKHQFKKWLNEFRNFGQYDYLELCGITETDYQNYLKNPNRIIIRNFPLTNPKLEKRLRLEANIRQLESIREATETEFQKHKKNPFPLNEELVFSSLGDRITIEAYLEKTDVQKLKDETEEDYQTYLMNPSAYQKFKVKGLSALDRRVEIENKLRLYEGALAEVEILLEEVSMDFFPLPNSKSKESTNSKPNALLDALIIYYKGKYIIPPVVKRGPEWTLYRKYLDVVKDGFRQGIGIGKKGLNERIRIMEMVGSELHEDDQNFTDYNFDLKSLIEKLENLE
jgi:hypothetical protein